MSFSLEILKVGAVKCSITEKKCLYDKDTLTSMSKAGFKFKLDGKAISLQNLIQKFKL